MTEPSKPDFQIEQPHALPHHEVLQQLNGHAHGLSQDEAAKRLETVGPNRLPAAAKDGLLKRFFKHFHDVLVYVLLVAAVVTAVLGHWVDTGIILAVVVINAIIGFIQEGKAEQALEGIRKMLSLRAHARRDGEWAEINADHLVPGDIVRLRSGDRVPADLRLIETVNLRVEESALTGESVPSEKKHAPRGAPRRSGGSFRYDLFGYDGRGRPRRRSRHRHWRIHRIGTHQPDDRRGANHRDPADPADEPRG